MRILYHHRTLGDGAEGIHIASMVEAFRRLGHEVAMSGVAVSGHAGGTTPSLIARVRALLPAAAFEAASMAVNAVEYVQLRRQFVAFRPDLLYKRHARYDLAALLAARRAGVPSVLEVNSLFTADDYERFEPLALRRLARAIERRALALASVVITVSTPLAKQAHALCESANVLVVPNGADPEWFDPAKADPARVRARYALGGATVVGWTGILREWHGLELLLDALAAVSSLRLLIVGDGPARGRLERRAADLGVSSRVVITGRVRHEEIRDYVAAMDIAVVADERTGIASPMKLLEYMSMARAVAAPRADNLRDLIEDGVDGVLFMPGDARDLAARLQELAGDAPRRRALGARARAKIAAERNWRSIAEVVLAAAASTSRSAG